MSTGDPKEVAAKAKEAALKRWRWFAEEARGETSGVIRADIWKDQVDDVIEFYAAWVPRSDNYQHDRARVMRLLAGRKNCRDFKQPEFNDTGLPKSSLDGQRPTVLVGPKPGESRETYRDNWPKKLRLSAGEQLDVVGVAKRLGKKKADPDPRYPSVARVAAETWLRGVEIRGKLAALKTACQKLVVKGLNTVREVNYQYFPFEGTVVYKDRHTDLRKELGPETCDLGEVAAALKELGGEPNPYLAVLVADGDKMGEAISGLESADAHREFSQALAGFAGVAGTIVKDSNGVLIYAGGDDVLAFLPVDKCLDCARKLHDRFAELLKKYNSRTLSVGVAIGHFMENLEDLLEYGRAAEKLAKQPDRDGLAVHLHKRGGSPVRVRSQWGSYPERRILEFASLMNQGFIPSKLPYELRAMAKLYENWHEDSAASAIELDLVRLIAKKQSKSTGTVRKTLSPYLGKMTATKLLDFAKELLVARQIATALRQAGERLARATEAAS
jgi:CRISPR-associated protein Cmr2